MDRAERGFTIIEVLLFLGISALLLTAALLTVGANINTNRFNDAVRSTASFLQGQYSATASGLNDRPGTLDCSAANNVINSPRSLGMAQCVVLGRFIVLGGNTVTSRYILGFTSDDMTQISGNDTDAINDLKPWIAGANVYNGRYGIPWSIDVKQSKVASAPSNSPTIGIAIVRSPSSGGIMYYSFPHNGSTPLNDTFINEANLNQDVDICLDDSANRQGHIKFATGQGSEIIKTDLQNSGGACS